MRHQKKYISNLVEFSDPFEVKTPQYMFHPPHPSSMVSQEPLPLQSRSGLRKTRREFSSQQQPTSCVHFTKKEECPSLPFPFLLPPTTKTPLLCRVLSMTIRRKEGRSF